jgi:hypothetical protein
LSEELQSLPVPSVGTVYNSISGKARSGLVIQAGRISGSTFYTSLPDNHVGEPEAHRGFGVE